MLNLNHNTHYRGSSSSQTSRRSSLVLISLTSSCHRHNAKSQFTTKQPNAFKHTLYYGCILHLNPSLPDRLNAPLTSLIVCLQQHTCLSVTMVFVSLYSHPTMDPFQSFLEQTNISPFLCMVAMIPFQSIVSNPPISIPLRPLLYILTPPFQVLHLHNMPTFLQLQPPPLLGQLVLVVVCIFLRISHVTCKTLGGSDVVNMHLNYLTHMDF